MASLAFGVGCNAFDERLFPEFPRIGIGGSVGTAGFFGGGGGVAGAIGVPGGAGGAAGTSPVGGGGTTGVGGATATAGSGGTEGEATVTPPNSESRLPPTPEPDVVDASTPDAGLSDDPRDAGASEDAG